MSNQILRQLVRRLHRVDSGKGSQGVQPIHLVSILEDLHAANVEIEEEESSADLGISRVFLVPNNHYGRQDHAKEVMSEPPTANIRSIHFEHSLPPNHNPVPNGTVQRNQSIVKGGRLLDEEDSDG